MCPTAIRKHLRICPDKIHLKVDDISASVVEGPNTLEEYDQQQEQARSSG